MVWTYAVLSIAASTITFEGGNDQALVKALARQTGKSVWTVVDPERTWPKFEAKYDPEKDDLAQVVGYKLGCSVVQTENALVLRPAWSMWYFSQQNRQNYDYFIEQRLLKSGYATKLAEVIDERVRFAPNGVAHPLYRAAPTGTTKRLRWHWFFEGAWLAIDGPELDQGPYLEAMAKALSGEVRETDETIRIDLDAAEFKRRAVATYDAFADVRDPAAFMPSASAKYASAVFQRLTPDEIQKAYRDPSTETEFPNLAADRQIQDLARLRLREDKKVNLGSVDPGESNIPPTIYSKINFEGPLIPVIFPPNNNVLTKIRSFDGRESLVF
ncbi:MAG: hypothetical protein ACK4XJ_10780 [Fimbriimonadaceae bacterium]